MRIDVDSNGNAWVVTSGGAVFRFDGAHGFVPVKGVEAKDIGIGGNGAVFVVGATFGVPYVWGGYETRWIKMEGGSLESISVDPAGTPWAVNQSKQILMGVPGAQRRKGH